METNASFSNCKKYRYVLWRIWDKTSPMVLFIGLNPSTADETEDDQTIRRCINFAKRWQFGGIYMVNLFAYRATRPKDMMAADDPIGKDNDRWLINISRKCKLVVAAWGNKGSFLGRNIEVKRIIPNLHCLKVNKTGEPAHPLFVKGNIRPVPLPAK